MLAFAAGTVSWWDDACYSSRGVSMILRHLTHMGLRWGLRACVGYARGVAASPVGRRYSFVVEQSPLKQVSKSPLLYEDPEKSRPSSSDAMRARHWAATSKHMWWLHGVARMDMSEHVSLVIDAIIGLGINEWIVIKININKQTTIYRLGTGWRQSRGFAGGSDRPSRSQKRVSQESYRNFASKSPIEQGLLISSIRGRSPW